ncbi:hypothetical protein [uncultured Duncaniella sp.]|uniref:hypothetical protein n=1 Tax=uncultured Duncaniella sp. TaxID=2768039 RepID=UPI0026273E21|nr:hypothetical protein [uncultured Duncaniella sp.]
MAPRRPIRLLDYADKAKAYPRELMLNFTTGALHAKAADGTEITIIKPIKIADAAGNEFGSILANEGGTIKIPDATDTANGLLTAADHKAYTDHIALYATDAAAGHIKLSSETDTPAAGTEAGAVGTSTAAARADHSHPTPTKVNSSSEADKLSTERVITIGGDASGSVSFDGSKDVTLNITITKSSNADNATNAANAAQATKLATERTVTFSGGASGSFAFDGTKDVTCVLTVAKPATAGAADTAAKLATPRTITVAGGATGSVSFDGSQDVTLNLTVPVPQASTVVGADPGTAAVGTSAAYARADHVHPLQTTVTGNAGTATKLATARTISLTGAVTGSGSFDGSGNLSIATSKGTVASCTTYNASIGTSWTGSSAPYTQTITVSGILASDNPIVDCVLSSTYSTAKAQLEAYSNIYQITTAANSITVRATAKTTTTVPIQLLCIR